jgi:hypothetical protein
VPEKVRFTPDQPIVEPVAVVLPAVLAPRRLIALFSAAAPGAATEIASPAVFKVMEALVAEVPVPA